jgi:acetylornithine deacetylase/succinyl-diaminopimelate desuccinylase-like protein
MTDHNRPDIQHAESRVATYPNATYDGWVTYVIERHLRSVSRTRFTIEARTTIPHPNPEKREAGETYTVTASHRWVDTLDEALELLREQETEVRESGVTSDTERRGRCTYCNDTVTSKGFALWTPEPFREFEDNYDGCRGWD